jgi:hypothetical protein
VIPGARWTVSAAALCLVTTIAATASCRGSAQGPPSDAKPTADATSGQGGGTPFTAKLSCPIPGRNSETVAAAIAYRAGPRPPAPCVGEACRTLIMTELHCTWDGFALGGQALTTSLMHGQGYMQGDAGSATGYDWGTLANGDSYLSRWTETLSATAITGTWTVVLGTGSLQGLTGHATIQCVPPGPTDTNESCTVTGTYSLAHQ